LAEGVTAAYLPEGTDAARLSPHPQNGLPVAVPGGLQGRTAVDLQGIMDGAACRLDTLSNLCCLAGPDGSLDDLAGLSRLLDDIARTLRQRANQAALDRAEAVQR
jgi:hypothetical protein